MSITSLRNNLKFGILGIFLGILIFQSVLLVQSPINFDKNQNEASFLEETTIPLDQGGYDLTKLPFLENTSPIVNWLENDLIDNATLRESPNDPNYPLYYGESNEAGSNIDDTNHYLEDFAVFLDSLFGFVAEDGENIIDYYNRLGDYGFQNSTEDGYYSFVTDGYSENSTVKDFMGNAQLILSLITAIENGDIESAQAESIISDQWDALNSVFYDETDSVNLFNHSTSDSQKYYKDQFVAALIGMKLDQLNIVESASIKAQDIMYRSTSDQSGFKEQNEYDIALDEDGTNLNNGRDLTTQAYAIMALIEYDLINTSADARAKGIEMAEAMYQKINSTMTNSSTNSLFLNEWETVGFNDVAEIDVNIDLKANAIMMMAIQRLFEVTGNMTYYNHLLNMYNAIQDLFLDGTNGNYYKSARPWDATTVKVKNLGTHAYLYRSLNALDSLASQSVLSLQLNSSDLEDGAQLLKAENVGLNITGQFYFDLPDYDGLAFILNSTFYYSVRGDDNTLLYNVTFNENITGETSLIYDISSLNTGIYTVSVMANFSGIETQFADIKFEIISGLETDSLVLESDSLYAGEQTELNLTIESTRVDPMDLTVQINGTTIQNQTLINQEVLNETSTSLVFDVQTLTNAEVGASSLTIEAFDGDDKILSKDVAFTISAPIVIQEISTSSKAFKGEDLEIEIRFQNLVDPSIDVKISVTGDYVSFTTITHTVGAGVSSMKINVSISEDAPYGTIDFELEINRASVGDLVKSEELTVSVKNMVEFISFNAPENSYQGRESVATLEVINHLSSATDIIISVDGEEYNESLISGENTIDIAFGNKFMNPYKMGTQGFTIKIVDSDGNLIYEEYVETQVKLSMGSILLGYVLPVLIPALGIVILKHLAMENKKRLS
ncbi:hypothetical protein [Candidatus Lokiarchaeum ossiferum]|uniref:hypothetical protein n=1 Tax=Candidatus Lokiarchaeum ossiferum TaxID=2951803 RepID=UPI00352DEB0D